MKIKELLERYSLKSRQSIYSWCEAAGIKLSSDEQGVKFASEDDIATLDKLQSHIDNGGSLKTFIKPIMPTVITGDSELDTVQDTHSLTEIDNTVLGELAKLIVNEYNPLRSHQLLKEASQEGWILTSDEVIKLIGVKPKGEHFVRGSWAFIRSGRIGNKLGWIVERNI
jgi:hypothetical protein